MERCVLVYTTFPSVVEAQAVGRAVVASRLAACVNIVPGMLSYYWWDKRVEEGAEVVMIVKTRAALAEAVQRAIKERHSYTTPALLVVPIEGGDPDYLAWIAAESRG